MLSDLIEALRSRRAILFVGSGVSAGLGLPTWNGLIEHIGAELGYDPDLFTATGANYYTLAEYYKIIRGAIGPLRSWMDVNWKIDPDRLMNSKVHKLIVELNFPIIYTTNYDRNIEDSFAFYKKSFHKIVNVRDIAGCCEETTQIVKLHGDFDDDRSIVITESDYFDRLSFDSPLDIKLRSDALGKTILFIGYSLSDINIRLLLYKLWRVWQASGYQQHRPKSYIFLPRPDPIQEAVLSRWDVQPITEDVDDPAHALENFLERILQQGGER
jgi:hypothetical protein